MPISLVRRDAIEWVTCLNESGYLAISGGGGVLGDSGGGEGHLAISGGGRAFVLAIAHVPRPRTKSGCHRYDVAVVTATMWRLSPLRRGFAARNKKAVLTATMWRVCVKDGCV